MAVIATWQNMESWLEWKNSEQLMYVVGATRPEYFQKIRKIVPDHFLLVPGVGAQGGDLKGVCRFGITDEIGLLVNSSRGIIYASVEENFEKKAREKARELRDEMSQILDDFKL
jgi:orotidine-5'-phosphate decarboxylase